MLTLSDSAVCADARHHRAILAGPKPCGKQAAAAVFSWFSQYVHLPLLSTTLTALWLLLRFLCRKDRQVEIAE